MQVRDDVFGPGVSGGARLAVVIGGVRRAGGYAWMGCVASLAYAGPAWAQQEVEKVEEVVDSGQRLEEIIVSGNRSQTLAIPVDLIGQSIGPQKLQATNITNADDALKYVPNLTVRKRYLGDMNGSVAVRGTNTTLPARTLVLVDGIPVTNFLGNDSNYSPRWGLIAPDEIQSIDVMYGPYSAQYSGNTIGAGIFITSHMPEKFEVTANVLGGVQQFKRYGTDVNPKTWQGQFSIGDKTGNLSWNLLVDHLDATGQTQNFQTVEVNSGSTTVAGTPVTGAYRFTDYLGADRWVIGALGSSTNKQTTLKGKAAWDIDNDTRLFAMVAYRDFRQTYLDPDIYLRDADGNRMTTGRVQILDRSYDISTLSNLQRGIVNLKDLLGGLTFQKRLAHGLTLEARGSIYEIIDADTRTNFINESRPRVNKTDDTGWRTAAATLTWRDEDRWALLGQKLLVGGDYGYYFSGNTIYSSPDWKAGKLGSYVEGNTGKSETYAFFAENHWRFTSELEFTFGLRWDHWRAFGGSRGVGTLSLAYPARRDHAWSPKAVLTWKPTDDWTLQAQAARSTRFPTLQELFQTVSSGGELVQSDPDLKPERATTFNLSVTKTVSLFGGTGRVSASIFNDTVDNALYYIQNSFYNSTFFQNIEKVRTRGIDTSANVPGMFDGFFDLYANLTYQDGKTIKNSVIPGSEGKQFPRIPHWRASFLGTAHPAERLSASVGIRYEGNQYNEFLNEGDFSGNIGAASRFLFVDTKIAWMFTDKLEASVGVDNIFDYEAYIGHPYPGRTFSLSLRLKP